MGAERSREKKERSSVGIFLISFSISLTVLLAIVLAVMSAVFGPPGSSRTGQESPPEAAEAGLSYRPDAAMGLNLLVISVRERSDEPHAFTLCRFDPAHDRILFVPIPPETVTTVKARTDTFAGHYDYAGPANARMAAENLLGCTVGRYVRLSRGGAVNLIDALGGLTYHFDKGYETDTVSVPAGTHLLNGELLYEVANAAPADMQAENWRLTLAGELLVQQLDAEADDRLDYLMEVFWNNTDTDLSQFDYATRRKALTYFLENEEKQVEIIPLSGSWNPEHTEFVPSEQVLGELRGMFEGE